MCARSLGKHKIVANTFFKYQRGHGTLLLTSRGGATHPMDGYVVCVSSAYATSASPLAESTSQANRNPMIPLVVWLPCAATMLFTRLAITCVKHTGDVVRVSRCSRQAR